jgi:hypothetical protein
VEPGNETPGGFYPPIDSPTASLISGRVAMLATDTPLPPKEYLFIELRRQEAKKE